MEKGFFRVCAGSLLLPVLLLSETSCVREEYALNRGLDTTLQLGGDSLTVPLGSTVPFTVDSLLKDNSVSGILSVNAQGTYVLSPVPASFEESVASIPVDDLKLDSVGQVRDFSVGLVPDPSRKSARMTGSIYQEMDLDFDFDKISDMVLDLSDMTFSPKTYLKFSFRLADLPSGIDPEKIVPDLEVRFPEIFSFDNAAVSVGNIVSVTEFDAGTSSFAFEIPMEGMDLSLTELVEHRLDFQAKVVLSGSIYWEEMPLPAGSLSGLPMDGSFSVGARAECSVMDIEPERVSGIFSASMPTRQLSVSFGQMPESLTSSATVLDFSNPRIVMSLAVNTGIPMDGVLRVVPVFDGHADVSLARQTDIRIPAGNPQTLTRYDFWLAKDRSEMPQEYTFCEFDPASLLYRIPDSLLVTVQAKTDTLQVHEYVFGQNTRIEAEIAPEIPLVFGEDLNMVYSDTVSGLPEDFTSFIEGRQIEILARIDNSFPLDIHMDLDLLDENGIPLPVETGGEQIVRACGENAGSEVSTLSFLFSDRDGKLAGKKVSSVRLGCSVRSGDHAAGLPVSVRSRLQAELKAKLEGGIILRPGKKDDSEE